MKKKEEEKKNPVKKHYIGDVFVSEFQRGKILIT